MTKYVNLQYTNKFNKDYKLAIKRGWDVQKLKNVVALIQEGTPLPEKYFDHALSGNYKNYRECHIEPDWLLVYKIENETLTLVLFRTGSHSDLF